MRVPIILAASVLALITHQASAETITRCGASKGTGYYFESPGTPKAQSGWQDDAITKGEFLLILDGDEPDIVSTDATGRTFSARAEGAGAIQLRGSDDHFRLVVVIYPGGAVEHYVFRLDTQGNGKVIWGSAKVGGLVPLSRLMEAACRKP